MLSGHYLLKGAVGHSRLQPKPHGFGYDVGYFWLDLANLPTMSVSRKIQSERFAALTLRRKDYFRDVSDATDSLYSAAITQARRLLPTVSSANEQQISLLANPPANLKIQMLSPLANYGFYFSPLTLYFIGTEGEWHWLLAEVSNTPWNERHYYLIPLDASGITDYSHPKNFHVSPYNPIDMIYQWKIQFLAGKLRLSITNHREQQAVFCAWFDLQPEPLTEEAVKQHLIRFPWQNVQIVTRIYWQALKLLMKGMPIYLHQKPKEPVK